MKNNKGQGLSMNMIIIAAIALLVLVIVSFLVLKGANKQTTKQECCEAICGEFNIECRGWSQDTLKCTFNYGMYGFPGVNEVFTFTISDDMKQEVCYATTNINNTEVEINDTA